MSRSCFDLTSSHFNARFLQPTSLQIPSRTSMSDTRRLVTSGIAATAVQSSRMQLPEQPPAQPVLSADSNLRRPSQILPDPLLQPQQMGTVPTYAMPQMQMPSPQLWGQMPQMQMPGSEQWLHREADSKNLDYCKANALPAGSTSWPAAGASWVRAFLRLGSCGGSEHACCPRNWMREQAVSSHA